jgi:hypothetical protein
VPFIDARLSGTCSECGEEIAVGDRIFWNPFNGDVFCLPCTPANAILQHPVSLWRGSPCPDCNCPMSAHNGLGCSTCSCLRHT